MSTVNHDLKEAFPIDTVNTNGEGLCVMTITQEKRNDKVLKLIERKIVATYFANN